MLVTPALIYFKLSHFNREYGEIASDEEELMFLVSCPRAFESAFSYNLAVNTFGNGGVVYPPASTGGSTVYGTLSDGLIEKVVVSLAEDWLAREKWGPGVPSELTMPFDSRLETVSVDLGW